MRRILSVAICAAILAAGINYRAIADYAATAGSGLIIRAFDATHGGTSLCAAANTQCQGVVPITSAGAEIVPSTAANQATEIASLATIATNTGAAIPAGTNQIGFAGLQANTTGGCTPTRVLSAATTNSTSVKGSAGTVCSITIIQNTATAADFRFYDSASAPTCSSATGVVANYGIQANTSSPGLSPNLGPFGMNFTTGIGFCLTAYDGTDTNNSASVTGIQINIAYK